MPSTSLAVYPATPAGSFFCLLPVQQVESRFNVGRDLNRDVWCGLFLSLTVSGAIGATCAAINEVVNAYRPFVTVDIATAYRSGLRPFKFAIPPNEPDVRQGVNLVYALISG